MKQESRAAIEDAIERLVNLLDQVDGDPDLEPYLSGYENDDDREADAGDEAEVDDADSEPSIGSSECLGSFHGGVEAAVAFIDRGRVVRRGNPWDQRRWAQGSDDDRERDPADEGEPEDGL